MKKHIGAFLILIILSGITFKVFARESNSVLLDMLEKSDIENINYLQNINITQVEYNEIKDFTLELIQYCKTDKEKMETIFKWVSSNIKYQNANNDPYQVFINKKAVCQGYSNLYATMMQIAKVPTIILQGDTYFGAHAWCLTQIDKSWYLADPTNNRMIYDVSEYDINYTKNYYTPYYINTDLFEDDLYVYSYYNGVALVKIKGDEKVVNIEDSILGMDITTFCLGALNNNVEEVNLSKNINNIEFNQKAPYLKKINVNKDNPNFSSYEGILYDKDFKNIVFIPSNIDYIDLKPISTITKNIFYMLNNVREIKLQEGTLKIDSYAFEGLESLEKVYIPKSVTNIEKDAFYNCNNFKIYTYSNSYAQKYAQENGIEVVLLDENKKYKGDLDKNGQVDTADAAIALNLYKYKNATMEDIEIADMDGNNIIDTADAAVILNMFKYRTLIEI